MFIYLHSSLALNNASPFNSLIHVNSTILKSVMASAAEAKLGALFYNAKDSAMLQVFLRTWASTDPSPDRQFLCYQNRERHSAPRPSTCAYDRVRQGEFLVLGELAAKMMLIILPSIIRLVISHRLMRSRYLFEKSVVSRRAGVGPALHPADS
jgi:hypothetical protein